MPYNDPNRRIVKSRLYNIKNVDDYDAARGTIYQVIWTTIRWLAPICPHITEEIYDKIFKKTQKLNTIHIAKWPNEKFDFISSELEITGQTIIDIIAIIRNKKSTRNNIRIIFHLTIKSF